jgi:hypothetical protein
MVVERDKPSPTLDLTIKKSASIEAQRADDLLPPAAGMAFEKPAAITVVNAKAAIPVIMGRATGGPAIASRASVL